MDWRTLFHSLKLNFIRSHIVAIVTITLLPALLAGAWLMERYTTSERGRLEAELSQKASEITLDLEGDLLTVKAMLLALARSQALLNGDFAAFRNEALQISRELGMQVALFDVQLERRILTTLLPFDPERNSAGAPEVLELMRESTRSGEFMISNAFLGQITKEYFVVAGMPVARNGQAAYFLTIGIPTRKFSEGLRHFDLPRGQVACILDRRGIVIAHSENHELHVGNSGPNQVPAAKHGIMKVKERDGTEVDRFYLRSSLPGWVVAITVPSESLALPGRRTMLVYIIGSGSLFFLAIALSYRLSNRLSQTAGALGVDRQPTREELQRLFDSAPDGVLLVDEQGLIVFTNEQAQKQFRYARDELLGQPIEALVPTRNRAAHAETRRTYTRAPSARPMGEGRDLSGLRKDDTEFPIEIALNPIQSRAGDYVMATVVDISARKRADEKLLAATEESNRLRRRLTQTQEDERLRLAHELHDKSGQSLAAIMFELKAIEAIVEEDARCRIRQVATELDGLGRELHHVAWELRPTAIDDLGLETALADYLSGWSQRFSIQADLHVGVRLDEVRNEVRMTIYRVAQEAMTNIARHARGASVANVIVGRIDGMLQLTVEDNGSGFDPDGAAKGGGLGLLGMRERLSAIGGTLEIESSADGSTIYARIPVEQQGIVG